MRTLKLMWAKRVEGLHQVIWAGYGLKTGEEGDEDMGGVFKKACRHTYII